jgi:hypothetical protein
MTTRDWLELWEGLEAERQFFSAAGEDDYPEAIRWLRDQVEAGLPENDCTAWYWIGEMFTRVINGRPPVTRANYGPVAEWYARHEKHPEIYDVNVSLYVYDGRSDCVRIPGITAVYERLQRLRARHPELP